MSNFLYSVNPVCKIVILVLLAIPVSFSQDVFFPLFIFIFLIMSGIAFAKLTPLAFWKSMKSAVIAAFCLCVFLIITRSLGETGDIQIGMLGISYKDIGQSFSLALRMLGFAYAAFLFSKTTDPVILTISLIEFWHLPPKAGYAFLSAYRFVPTFQDEFQKIQLAYDVRGGGHNQGVFTRYLRLPSYLTSLMIEAIRSGERVSIAMEARAFCLYEERTYYREVSFGTSERKMIVITVLFLLISLSFLGLLGLLQIGIGF